jgi:hypothetical protein
VGLGFLPLLWWLGSVAVTRNDGTRMIDSLHSLANGSPFDRLVSESSRDRAVASAPSMEAAERH